MARGVNKVILVGRVGKDPEVRYTQGGAAVANFSMATSEQWNDKQTGEKVERTEWHNIVAWNRLGEIVGEYVTKGAHLYVEGKLQTDEFEKEGQKHYRTKVIALSLQMLDSRRSQEGGQQQSQQYAGTAESQQAAFAEDDFDDDIPF